MKRRSMCLILSLLFLLAGCVSAPDSREGILMADYRSMSREDLQRYVVRLNEEIMAVEKGGAAAAAGSREDYLGELRSKRYGAQREIAAREIQSQDERRRQYELQRPLP